jgi:hypothetical protein
MEPATSPRPESLTMPKSKMIVVWGSEDLLSTSIKFFLASKEDWKVVSILNKEDQETLIQFVETTMPDIVIIHQGCHSVQSNLPMRLLQKNPALKVITISLENNMMEVLSKQKIMVKQASDLITVIENES